MNLTNRGQHNFENPLKLIGYDTTSMNALTGMIEGEIIWNTTEKQVYGYDGTAWVPGFVDWTRIIITNNTTSNTADGVNKRFYIHNGTGAGGININKADYGVGQEVAFMQLGAGGGTFTITGINTTLLAHNGTSSSSIVLSEYQSVVLLRSGGNFFVSIG